MPLRDNELARRTPQGLELRAEPMRIRWEFPDLVTADGHELRCTFTGSVRAVADRTEQRMLEELLLDGKPALFAEDVARYFSAPLRTAAIRVAQLHEARQWIEDDALRREMIEAIKSAALPVAFACGLEVLPPFQAELQSPTFERQRVRGLQQALAEKEAAGQVEHFHRAAELLKHFQVLRSAAPELSAGRVLEQISASDRGSLMQSLLMAGARDGSAAILWAVAGPYLVRIDVSGRSDERTNPKPELLPLPPTLGPLRSVRADDVDGRRVLLIGAQRGFFQVKVDDPSSVQAYSDLGFESALGFNRIVYWPQRRQFCATHSEAGIVSWDIDSTETPTVAIRSAALGLAPAPMPELPTANSNSMSLRAGGGGPMGPRNIRRDDADALVFSAGGRVFGWDGRVVHPFPQGPPSEIVALVSADRSLLSVHEDGIVCEYDVARRQILCKDQRFGRVRAAASLPWLGSRRLLLAGEEGPVQCIGWEDTLITQYFSPYRGLRVLAGSSAFVAAVSPDRQRLILWNSWNGKQPAAEIFIGAQARHRIADITFS